jgi:aspartyl-tRNA(Asn)/glutamyl-tRNA(Gln) amidotransferase subunit B
MRAIHTLVRYLEICDGNMQEGSFRCDANVSIRPRGESKLGTRTELKNLNSFRFVEKAIEIEVERQIELIEDGGKVVQETRLYDPDKDETRPMRSKEEANDYRYFPDPDLLPVAISAEGVEKVRAALPELPQAKRARFIHDYELPAYDVEILIGDAATAGYFEACAGATSAAPKIAANWIIGELTGALNRTDQEITDSPISPNELAALLDKIEDNTISGKIAKDVFEALWNGEGSVDTIIKERSLEQITDTASIDAMVQQVIDANPEQLAQYRAGKTQVLGFLVGQVMKASQGKANPKQVNETLRRLLG